ncbi:MAG: hypothetical protein ACRCS3_12725 [Paracoccaceae bacterium]
MRVPAAFVLLLLAACGPVSVQQAERECVQKARLAQQPRGEVGIGVDSNGRVGGNIDVTVTSDFLLGRDPAQVFETCVIQRSGQLPSRAVYDMPGWQP